MMIHDLVDPNDPEGRTYKQVNADRQHAIPIGALVEHDSSGVRLFVVAHTRDCDMTPLYSLSVHHPRDEDEYQKGHRREHGYSEDHLVVVKEDGYYEEE